MLQAEGKRELTHKHWSFIIIIKKVVSNIELIFACTCQLQLSVSHRPRILDCYSFKPLQRTLRFSDIYPRFLNEKFSNGGYTSRGVIARAQAAWFEMTA